MREVLKGMLWTASLKEVEDLVAPLAMGAYTGYGIRGVLTVSADVRPKCVAVLPQMCVPVDEVSQTPAVYFNMACAFAKHFSPLVVHCHAGMNRSRVFAAAILHRVYQIDLETAIRISEPMASIPSKQVVLSSMREWATTLPEGIGRAASEPRRDA